MALLLELGERGGKKAVYEAGRSRAGRAAGR